MRKGLYKIRKDVPMTKIILQDLLSLPEDSVLNHLSKQFANLFDIWMFRDFFIPPKTKKTLESEKPEQLGAKKLIASKLTPDQQTCLNLLSAMFHRRKFSTTGRMNKNTIQNTYFFIGESYDL